MEKSCTEVIILNIFKAKKVPEPLILEREGTVVLTFCSPNVPFEINGGIFRVPET